jgi:hypothetical protein
MRTTTLGELGPKLPIGFVKGKTLNKDFTLRPYKSWVDRVLNVWREANEGRSMAALAAKFLSLLVSTAGGEEYTLTAEKDSTAEQELRVYRWYWADVMYAYLFARVKTVGSIIEVPYACPNRFAVGAARCDAAGLNRADLNSTEVQVVEDVAELKHWIELRDGFPLRDGKTAKELCLQPVRFTAQALPGSSVQDINAIGYNHLREAIAEIKGVGEYSMTNSEIDEISKVDALILDRAASKVTAGADMRTHLECPKCGCKIINALNWSLDSFFDSSVPLEALMT